MNGPGGGIKESCFSELDLNLCKMAFNIAAPVMFLLLAILVASALGYYSDYENYISISNDFRRRPNGGVSSLHCQVHKYPPHAYHHTIYLHFSFRLGLMFGKMTKKSI